MKSTFAVILLFVGIFFKSSVNALNIKCSGIDIKIKEEHITQMKDCGKSVGVEKITDLGPANAGCFSKCMMEKQNLVDGSGKPHKENIMKALDEGVPPAIVESWKKTMENCLDTEGVKVKSPDDATCSSYLPLTMCVHAALLSACKLTH